MHRYPAGLLPFGFASSDNNPEVYRTGTLAFGAVADDEEGMVPL